MSARRETHVGKTPGKEIPSGNQATRSQNGEVSSMRIRAARSRALAALILLSAALFAGCGGDNGASQYELDRARAEGEKEAQDQARVDQLQQQVRELQKEQKQSGGTAGTRPAGGGSAPMPSMSPAKICGGGVGGSSSTSCEFAYNVAGEYGSNPGASSISAYSPVTGRSYTMSCAPMSGWTAVCTGGSGAAVFIP